MLQTLVIETTEGTVNKFVNTSSKAADKVINDLLDVYDRRGVLIGFEIE